MSCIESFPAECPASEVCEPELLETTTTAGMMGTGLLLPASSFIWLPKIVIYKSGAWTIFLDLRKMPQKLSRKLEMFSSRQNCPL